jgi:beta-lactamase class A
MVNVSSLFTLHRYKESIRRNWRAAPFCDGGNRSMLGDGQGAAGVKLFESFSCTQRAATLAGLGPALLMGCAVHGAPQFAGYLPAPDYRVILQIPSARAAPAPKPNVPAPAALVSSLDALTRNFSGVVGVAVTSVESGWVASFNGERKMPQQSVSKLWVAMTVLDQVDRGRIRLEDPVTITESDFTLFHQPIASLVKNGVGYTASVGEIMRRSMTMSDNTCNDKLLRLVGGPKAVRDFIARRGLGAIRFGPGERDLQSLTAGMDWKPEYSKGNAFAVARSRLDPVIRLAAFEAYVADPIDGAAPAAIADALARLKRGELLSAGSTDWLIRTMASSRTGKARLRGAIPLGWEFAHKTGTGQDLKGRTAGFNDVGILTAPDGRSYAIAVMIGDTPRPVRERQQLMQGIAAAVVANHR